MVGGAHGATSRTAAALAAAEAAHADAVEQRAQLQRDLDAAAKAHHAAELKSPRR